MMTDDNKPFVMATLSEVAYKDLEEAKETFNHWGFTKHKFFDIDGAQCYLVWNDDDAVVIFRGTEPKQWSDVKADLNAFKRRGRYKHGYVHGGFQGELDKIWDELDTELSVLEDRDIHVTGHSLGGAMATLAAKRISEEYDNVHCIYTFGSPSIMTDQIWEDGHFRVYLENDPVPFLPPFPYVHWGVRINAETLDWDEDHPIGDITKIDARDHSIKEYLKILRRHSGI